MKTHKKTKISKKMENELLKIIKKHGEKGSVIPIMQDVQKKFGYLSVEAMDFVSDKINIPLSQLYGVATFYAQFSLLPSGKCTIKCCMGTACYVSGAEGILKAMEDELSIKEGETSEDKKFTLQSVACVGSCSLAPVVMVENKANGKLSPEKARRLIRKKSKELDG